MTRAIHDSVNPRYIIRKRSIDFFEKKKKENSKLISQLKDLPFYDFDVSDAERKKKVTHVVAGIIGERLGQRRGYDDAQIAPVRMGRRRRLGRVPRLIALGDGDAEGGRGPGTGRAAQRRGRRRVAVAHLQHASRRIHCKYVEGFFSMKQ